jgi:hypothetical protein
MDPITTVLDVRGKTSAEIVEALKGAPPEDVIKLGEHTIRAEVSPLPDMARYVTVWDETVTKVIVTASSFLGFFTYRAQAGRPAA